MFKLVSIFVLIGACVLLSECSTPDHANASNNSSVAGGQAAETNGASKSVVSLANVYITSDLCKASNLKNLRSTVRAILDYDEKAFQTQEGGETNPLYDQLAHYIDTAWAECMRIFENDWWELYEDEFEEEGLFTPLVYLDLANINLSTGKDAKHSRLAQMGGALKLLQSAEAIGQVGPQLRTILDEQHNLETGESLAKSIDLNESKHYLNEYLFKGCKLMLDKEDAQAILGPVIDLSASVLMKNPTSSDLWELSVLEWASRTVSCQGVLKSGLDELAKIVSS